MKFLALIAFAAVVSYVSALPTKGELEERAKKLELRIETAIRELEAHPKIGGLNELVLLREYDVELRVLAAELLLPIPEFIQIRFETRLSDLEDRVEKEISRLEAIIKGTTPAASTAGSTEAPSTARPSTARPTTEATKPTRTEAPATARPSTARAASTGTPERPQTTVKSSNSTGNSTLDEY